VANTAESELSVNRHSLSNAELREEIRVLARPLQLNRIDRIDERRIQCSG